MSTGRLTVRDLIEEAKKRIVLLLVCVFGLSYLMSLTSSSVWVNLPAATSLIFFLRYISLDLDVRRRNIAHSEVSSLNQSSQRRAIELPKIPLEKSSWRRKVNSPAVEAAIDQFTRHLVSEWVTDLWYSRITPDKDGPEELVQIMNGVLGEVSCRARDINLINLLTRDIINLFCNHLELYRTSLVKIGKQELGKLSADHRDPQLRLVLAAENKLHPALFSVKAEHKVLQLLMSGLISFTFKPEDLQCSFFRYTVRELLACAVMRPILNLANPRVINEKIESLVLSFTNKADKGVAPSAEEAHMIKPNGPSRTSTDHHYVFQDRSTVGVELVQFKNNSSRTSSDEQMKLKGNTKDPKSSDVQLSQSCNSLPVDSEKSKNVGGEWGHMLDIITRRKTRALAPEHFENMWTKGRNYRNKDGTNRVADPVVQKTDRGISNTLLHSQVPSNQPFQDMEVKVDISKRNHALTHHGDRRFVDTSYTSHVLVNGNQTTHPPVSLYQEKLADQLNLEDSELESESSYTTEDDESSNVTGLDSPGTRVWDSKNKINGAVPRIRHPLENSEVNITKKSGKGRAYRPRTSRTHPGRKRSRSSNQKVPILQEVERTSCLLGDGLDILNAKGDPKTEELNDDHEVESWGRAHSGAAASSSMSSISASGSYISSVKSSESSVLEESFLKLRCEVLGANVVKSGSGTFAVYSVAVTDADNNSWSIKRRFRHFEELHRRLKEFPEYNLSLPPKHFLSSGLDLPVVQERCKLLDKYLKKLLQVPVVSGSIEVWDFLSVDSQTYMFSDSLSIIQTLSVDLDDKPYEKVTKIQGVGKAVNDQLYPSGEHLRSGNQESSMQINKNFEPDSLRLKKRNPEQHLANNSGKDGNLFHDNSGSDSENRLEQKVYSFSNSEKPVKAQIKAADGLKETSQSFLETALDPTIPIEWVPPNLSVPILDLVDVIFQLQDGGWIRRQAFWIAKQVLQLGMGDAFDDWLIEKIQLLRKGSVIASAINRIEKILWPDGIFITKHPNRKRPTPLPTPKEGTQKNHIMENKKLTPEQQLEAARRAKFVYELMIDKAPAALVGLVGRKEYERCAQDIYFFLQSSVCLKQLAFELLELLLLAAFPELDDIVRQCHAEKEQFGEVEE